MIKPLRDRSEPPARHAALDEERRRERHLDTIDRVLGIVSPVALIALWELAAHVGILDVRFFSRPTRILAEFSAMLGSGELSEHIAATLGRLSLGFFGGAAAGVAIGLSMGISRWTRAILNPVATAIYPIPKVAIFPLVILIFGLGEASKIFTVGLSVFFQMLFPTIGAVLRIPRIYLDVGHNFGARGLVFYRRIVLPAALPFIFVALRVALGVGLLVTITVEFVGADEGVGYIVWNSWQIFNVDRMFVGLAVAALLGYLSFLALDRVQQRLIPWRQ